MKTIIKFSNNSRHLLINNKKFFFNKFIDINKSNKIPSQILDFLILNSLVKTLVGIKF